MPTLQEKMLALARLRERTSQALTEGTGLQRMREEVGHTETPDPEKISRRLSELDDIRAHLAQQVIVLEQSIDEDVEGIVHQTRIGGKVYEAPSSKLFD